MRPGFGGAGWVFFSLTAQSSLRRWLLAGLERRQRETQPLLQA
jgi:hypothetical protein